LIADIGTIDWQNCSDATVLQLIRFVQDSVRYRAESNGIHTHTPKQINETLRRRTGDCKDKSALLVVLLKRLGVEARLTLVHDGIKDDLQKLQPSPYWFNHMVVQFDFEGKTYLVDPTLQKQGGTLATQCTPDFRLCLPLCKGGSELVEVEKIIPQESLVMIHEFDLRFDTMDQCTLKVTRKYMRERADYMRFYLASRSKAELAENYLQSAMGMFCREFTTANAFSIVEDDLTKNVLHTEEIYNLTGSNDDPENQAIAFTSDLHDDFKMPKRNTHPVTTGPACTCRHEVRVIYGFAQEKIEDHFEEKNQFFEYRDSVETDDNTIISKISFTGLREDVNADEVDECTAAIIKVNQRCGTTLPLRAKVEKETSLTDHLYYLVPLGLACAAAWWFLKG